jgi:low temperature requirement protein LtrA
MTTVVLGNRWGRERNAAAAQTSQPCVEETVDVVRKVSWLELFFDLVFVGAVAQVAAPLGAELTAAESARFALLFVVIWWAWLGQTVFSTRFGGLDPCERILTFAQICAAAAMAVNSQGALDSRDSAGFAAAYGVMRLLLSIQYARIRSRTAPELIRRYLIGCRLSATLWLASAFVPAPARFAVWGIAFLVDVITSIVAETHGTAVPPHSEHLPERFGLFTIILLGEAMSAIMRGMGHHETWPPAAALSVLAGLLVVFQVWWWYFHAIGVAAVRRVRSRRQMRRALAWSYAHLPLYLGLVLAGVGFEHMIVSAEPWPDPSLLITTAIAVGLVIAALAGLRGTVDSDRPRRLKPSRYAGLSAEPGTAASAAWNPIFECVPSQKGFFVDPPQRQSAIGRRST